MAEKRCGGCYDSFSGPWCDNCDQWPCVCDPGPVDPDETRAEVERASAVTGPPPRPRGYEMDILNEIKFWSMAITESRRTIVCSPENESRVKSYIDAHGLGGVYAVVVSQVPGDGQMYVIDQNAIEARTRQMLQGWNGL